MADVLCAVCQKKLGFLGKVKIKDGCICSNCAKKTMLSQLNNLSLLDIENRFDYLDDNQKLRGLFSPTDKIDGHIAVDMKNQLFTLGTSNEVFLFSDLIDFELNEDIDSVSNGKNKTEKVVSFLYITVSIDNEWYDSIDIYIIQGGDVKKSSLSYKLIKASVDEIISLLKDIIKSNKKVSSKSSNKSSNADEILKYKQLLDMGAITEEEFNQKKKQLLI